MTTLQALILGIIQGFTEFLPVSSSGHLLLTQYLFHLSNPKDFILFDLVCHIGTLIPILCIFNAEIKKSFTTNRAMLLKIFLGTLPLFFVVGLIKPIKEVYNHPEFLGLFFLFNSLLLYLAITFERTQKKDRPFYIGLFQVFALFPGISRSGSTISAGRFFGWSFQEAVTFSFLLAIPAILGGVILEGFQVYKANESLPSIGAAPYIAGFISSGVVGYGALKLLITLATKEKFRYFVWYCLLLGVVTLFWFNW